MISTWFRTIIIPVIFISVSFIGCSAFPTSYDPTNTANCNSLSYRLAHGRTTYSADDITKLEKYWISCELEWRRNVKNYGMLK